MHHRSAATQGALAVAPILIGVAPFGLIAGVAAIEAGLEVPAALAVSFVIFAGAAQLATVDLIGAGTAIPVIILTALVINARFVMYSGALAPHVQSFTAPQKVSTAYLLTDQAFAVSVLEYDRRPMSTTERYAYYTGAGLALWATWQAASVVGVILGTGVPAEWSLDFAVPLVFMALVFPAIRGNRTAVAGAVSALLAVVAAPLAYNSGLLVAAAGGIVAGMLVPEDRG